MFQGLLGGIGSYMGNEGVTEGSNPPADMNNLQQPVNNISSLNNQNDSNQLQSVNDANEETRGYSIQNPFSKDREVSMFDPSIQPDSLVNEMNTQDNMFNDLPDERGLTDNMRMTKDFEGTVGNVYTDTMGLPHYGVGHQMTRGNKGSDNEYGEFGLANDASYGAGQQWVDLPVDSQRIDETFKSDYANAQNSAQNVLGLGDTDFQNIPENIRGIVTDMVFNMGASGLSRKFPNFLSDVRAGDYKAAASQLKFSDPSLDTSSEGESDYFNQTGDRAQAQYDTLSNDKPNDTLSYY